MSIVRVGLAETPGYAEGYEAIFGKKEPKKKDETPKAESGSTPSTPSATEEKKATETKE